MQNGIKESKVNDDLAWTFHLIKQSRTKPLNGSLVLATASDTLDACCSVA